MQIMLAGQTFKSKDELKRVVGTLLRATPLDTELRGSELALVLALLQHHSEAHEKIGCGADRIFIRATNGGGASRGFFVRRADGTEIDFSYSWCVNCLGRTTTPHDTALEAAFRVAVVNQKNAARDRAFAGGAPIECPRSKTLIMEDESDVHHEPSFASLVTEFLAAHNLRRDDIKLDGAPTRLTDLTLERAWRLYHKTRAQLFVVSRTWHEDFHRNRKAQP